MNMSGKPVLKCLMTGLAILFAMTALAGCDGEPGGSTAAGDEIEATAVAVEVPDGVLRAQESVLTFMRTSANECVPPAGASWRVEEDANPPAGYDVFRFRSDGCTMTITMPEQETEGMHYHVALGDGPTGFCWQAVVDSRGDVIKTGNAAQTDPTLGNPAETYCTQQGFRFEVVDLPVGGQCGMCVFDDGRMCNAWAFFHNACTLENAPPVD
jgi:putative hemolysin